MYLFALRTLISDQGKLLIALIGVIFSLVLVNVQGGLYFGLIRKASLLIDNCDADIWIARRGVENVDLPAEIPEIWLNRIRGLAGIAQAAPYVIGSAGMSLTNGEYEAVWIIGFDPHSKLGSPWSFADGSLSALRQPNAIAVDELDDKKLGYPRIGDVVEINAHRARVAATTTGTQNFITTPVVFTTIDSARRFLGMSDRYCSYYLIQASPNTSLERLSERIRERIPDVDVYTAEEFHTISQDYWMQRTGIGISFGASTLLGLLVGLLMVGQSLYSLALDHLDDYATLKAIGAEDRQVHQVVLLQAILIATVGSVIGVAITLLIQHLCASALAPIEIPFELLLGGIVLVFGICLGSCVLPFQRIRRVDPATVLQG